MSMLKKLQQHGIDKLTCARLIVAMIHADQMVMADEIDHLQHIMEDLQLSEDEKITVQQDLITPTPLADLIPQIKLPKELSARQVLLEQVQKVAMSDGVLDPQEVVFFQDLKLYLQLA